MAESAGAIGTSQQDPAGATPPPFGCRHFSPGMGFRSDLANGRASPERRNLGSRGCCPGQGSRPARPPSPRWAPIADGTRSALATTGPARSRPVTTCTLSPSPLWDGHFDAGAPDTVVEVVVYAARVGRAGAAQAALRGADLPARARAGGKLVALFDNHSGSATPGFTLFLSWADIAAWKSGRLRYEQDRAVWEARALQRARHGGEHAAEAVERILPRQTRFSRKERAL